MCHDAINQNKGQHLLFKWLCFKLRKRVKLIFCTFFVYFKRASTLNYRLAEKTEVKAIDSLNKLIYLNCRLFKAIDYKVAEKRLFCNKPKSKIFFSFSAN